MNKEYRYEPVIGLEVHAQLLTNTKIFCGCSAKFGAAPNTNVCPVCLGHPGVLPVLNERVVEFAMKMGFAVNCSINQKSIIARKNYFYPDSPKGYQISQFELPVCENGHVIVSLKDKEPKKIRIKRIHIEEDAGKSVHDLPYGTGIDLNRCGTPLIEIVTEPDISSAEEAAAYMMKIRQLVQYLGICDGNMEEGSLRCDANVSIRPRGSETLGTKTEIKNMNSFRNVEKAILFEINRQHEILEDGGSIIQQTLLWDADAEEARPMRSKEEAHDYRYFPDPDLLPVIISDSWLSSVRESLPELPASYIDRFTNVFGLPVYDAEVLTQEKSIATYFDEVCKFTTDYKSASNWIMGEVMRILKEQKIEICSFPITAEALAELINLCQNNTISIKIAREVFGYMIVEKKTAGQIVKEKQLVQLSDEGAIRTIIAEILTKFPNELEELKSGKEKVFGFFVGQIMKETKGKANPQVVNTVLRAMVTEL